MTTTETTSTETTPTETTIGTYFAMWNEPDRAKRLEVIARAWAPELHYVDPLSDVTGHGGLADMVDTVRARIAGRGARHAQGAQTRHGDVQRFLVERLHSG